MVRNNRAIVSTNSGLFTASMWITQGKMRSGRIAHMDHNHKVYFDLDDVNGELQPTPFGIWMAVEMGGFGHRRWSGKFTVDLKVNGKNQGKLFSTGGSIALFRPVTGNGYLMYFPSESKYFEDLLPEYRDDAGRIDARFMFDDPTLNVRANYQPFAVSKGRLLDGVIAEQGHCPQGIEYTNDTIDAYREGVRIELLLGHSNDRPSDVVFVSGPRPIR